MNEQHPAEHSLDLTNEHPTVHPSAHPSDHAKKGNFSVKHRAKSFVHAGRGVWVFLLNTPNALLQIAMSTAAICLGIYFSITSVEWIAIILASGLVLTAEAFNSAIEIDIDLTSPQYHPYARDTKDVAAGAVLISSVTAAIIGLLIFVPYLV
ncbi:MAG: putative diacylglycerol kinase [Candidatus Parcubacteria bacterium]|nr:putative diacylglycerol kinase [Candidatus Parcubacteria bacterium]